MLEAFSLEKSKFRCREFRKKILEISQNVTALHIAPAFSCMEIIDVIYHYLMDGVPQSSDTFLLSKGHGCMAQYVILNKLGILSDEELNKYCTSEGRLGAHPDFGAPGIAASTGSLGHGLGMAVGIAYASRLQKKQSNTYAVISDGELQEGSTWEALMVAANLKLSNLVVFLDLNNRISINRLTEEHPAFYPVDNKLTAFGWRVEEVDGHDAKAIYQAANQLDAQKPTFVICHTVKGKGISYMEDTAIWHYRSPNESEYKQAMEEL